MMRIMNPFSRSKATLEKEEEIRQSYQRMTTSELATRLGSGEVSEAGMRIGKEVLECRNLDGDIQTTIAAAEAKQAEAKKSSKFWIWIVGLVIIFGVRTLMKNNKAKSPQPSSPSPYSSSYDAPSSRPIEDSAPWRTKEIQSPAPKESADKNIDYGNDFKADGSGFRKKQ